MNRSSASLRVTMVGHSTVLLEMGGLRILTDPYFGQHGNPAYRRLAPPGASREQCAEVDLVLLSHDHWDHRDRRFFGMLPAAIPVVVPAAAREWMRLLGVRRPLGIRWWDSLRHQGLTVWSVPARHFGVACGYVLEHGQQRVYFAGDTFYSRFFQKIARELAPSVAMLPLTTYRLPMTMGEDQAVRAVRDLEPRAVIPIHLGLQPRFPWWRTAQSVEGFARKLQTAVPGTDVVHLREAESWVSEPEAGTAVGKGVHAVTAAHSRAVAGEASRSRDRHLAPVVVRLIGHHQEEAEAPHQDGIAR